MIGGSGLWKIPIPGTKFGLRLVRTNIVNPTLEGWNDDLEQSYLEQSDEVVVAHRSSALKCAKDYLVSYC